MPVSVAVVCDELYVRSALGHATHEGKVIAYGPQSSRWRHVISRRVYAVLPLTRKNDHRCPIGAPQGDFGQRGSGAVELHGFAGKHLRPGALRFDVSDAIRCIE
jgi:hypothetical protein